MSQRSELGVSNDSIVEDIAMAGQELEYSISTGLIFAVPVKDAEDFQKSYWWKTTFISASFGRLTSCLVPGTSRQIRRMWGVRGLRLGQRVVKTAVAAP